MSSFKDLKVWTKTRELVKDIYKITSGFPVAELYGITSQIRRSSISISNNIVEGASRSTKKDFNRFLTIAFGSAIETENLLIICSDLELISEEQFQELETKVIEIQKMIKGLSKGILANN